MNLEEALAILDEILTKESLNDIQELVFRQTWEGKTYAEIAEGTNYDPDYIKYVGYQLWQMLSNAIDEKVTKSNFKSLLRRKLQSKTSLESTTLSPSVIQDSLGAPNKQCSRDWGEAVDVSLFYGRAQEQAILERWIVHEQCRLVTLMGMGGIGKTSLAIKVAENIQDRFDRLIWRSLRNAPHIQDLLSDLLQFLSGNQELDSEALLQAGRAESIDSKISRLIECLRLSRCLLVLDNVESILLTEEGLYNNFFRALGEASHQSCVLLTTREKPKDLAWLEGDHLPTRSFPLSGLQEKEIKEIFSNKGSFLAQDQDWQELIRRYAGNPLALKIISTTAQELFNSNITEFLQQEAGVFGDIHDLLDQQFRHLSDLEKEILYWLAIEREPVSLSTIRKNMVLPPTISKVVESLEALGRRSLLEITAGLFTLQPVVLEYVTQQFIDNICNEIITEEIELFRKYPLIKAQAKDYIRETQTQLILRSILMELNRKLINKKNVEYQLIIIKNKIQQDSPLEPGYLGGNIINLICELKDDLSNLDFSYMTIWQAYLEKVSLHNTNFAFSNLEKSTFAEVLGGIYSIALSSDGSLLLTGGDDGEIRLWDFEKARQYLSWSTFWIFSVAFSPDNKIVASGTADGTIGLWDAKTGQSLKILQGHTNLIFSIAFSPDGKILVSGSTDGTVRLWDVHTGECTKVLEGLSQAVLSVAFSPDGRFLAGTGHDHSAFVWDLHADECCQILKGHTELVFSLAFSPSGQSLATGSQDQTIRLWDIYTGQCLKIFEGHTDLVSAIAFSPNGQILASGSKDQTGRLWDVNTGRCLKLLQAYTNCFWSLKFHPAGKLIVSGGTDKIIKFWDVDTGQCIKTLQGFSTGFLSVAFNPQGPKQIVASAGEDKFIRLWDISEGRCVKSLEGHSSWVWAIAFSPDGCTLASASEDKIIRLWDVNTGQCLKILQGHISGVISVAFSPSGQILATGSHDQTVRLWDINTGRCLKILQGHTGWTWSSIFSPNGLILASAGEDKTIRIWDIKTTECLKILEGHAGTILSIAFCTDSTKLASASGDQTIKLWNIHTGHCTETLTGHQMAVTSVVFSPTGTQIASASLDQTVRIWDTQTGECISILKGHSKGVWSVDFSPDGQYLISGSKDETIKYWNLKTGEAVNTLEIKKLYENMNILGTTGLTDAQRNTLRLLGATEKAV